MVIIEQQQRRVEYPQQMQALETLSTPTVAAEVDRKYFFGTNRAKEYTMGKRRRVNKIHRDHRENPERVRSFLDEHPVIAFPDPIIRHEQDADVIATGIPTRITLLDGHNRVRYAPHEVKPFRTILLTAEQGASLYDTSVDDFYDTLDRWRDEALADFSSINPNIPKPLYARLDRVSEGSYAARRAEEILIFQQPKKTNL